MLRPLLAALAFAAPHGAASLLAQAPPPKQKNPVAINVRGKVTDAETGEAIPEYRLIVGSPYSVDMHTTWQGHLVYKRSGPLAWKSDNPWEKTRLRIEVEGYAPWVSPILQRGAGDVTLDVKLKPDAGLEGVVVDKSGKPLAGAQIGWATQTLEMMVEHGKLRYATDSRICPPLPAADAAGKFKLPPEVDPRLIVASHPEGGYAAIYPAEFTPGGKIALVPWSRAVGRVLENGKPAAGAKVSLGAGRQPKPEWPVVSHQNSLTVGPDGTFKFDHLAPGSHYFQRWAENFSLPGAANFEAVSERTHKLTLGGPGRKVKGRVASVEGDNAIPASFPWPELRLGAYLSFPWRYGDKIPPDAMPKLPPPVALEGDGSFTIENLPAGSYNVQIIATAPAKAESGPGAAPAARFYALDRIEIPLVDDDDAVAILDVGPIRVGRIAAKP